MRQYAGQTDGGGDENTPGFAQCNSSRHGRSSTRYSEAGEAARAYYIGAMRAWQGRGKADPRAEDARR